MIHSNWGDWFVRNGIETTDIDGASAWYLGCNGFVIRSPEATIYIDPYFGNGDPPWIFRMIPVPMNPEDATKCDTVLVTHEHIDHMHPPSHEPLVRDLGAELCAPAASFSEDRGYDGEIETPEENQRVVAGGDCFEVGDFTINVAGSHDPDAIEPVSYVIEHDSGTFFHAGDGRPSEAFREIGETFEIDLGAVAFGTAGEIYDPEEGETQRMSWYMNENDVIQTANQLGLDRVLPTHYDMWRGVGADPKVLHEHAASHEYPSVIETVKIGDRVNFDSPGIVQSEALR